MSKNILRKLDENEYFYIHNGGAIKSIKEAPKVLAELDESIFRYHLNPETNDFANWLEAITGDNDFGRRLRSAFTKDEIISVISKEIKNAESITSAINDAKRPIPVSQKTIQKNVTATSAAKVSKKAVAVKEPAIIDAKGINKKSSSIPKKTEQKPKTEIAKKPAVVKSAKKKAKKAKTSNNVVNAIAETEKQNGFATMLSSGIKEYLLGIITGLILGLIIGSVVF